MTEDPGLKPFEYDLSALASRGITRGNRVFVAGITFSIPALILIIGLAQFHATGVTPRNIAGILIVSPFGIFNLVLGIYALQTTRAPGAVHLRWDPDELVLYFANGRADRYRWRTPSMRLTMLYLKRADKSGDPYTFLRSFWRPPTRIPRDLGENLLRRLSAIGVPVEQAETKVRYYGMATVYSIRGSRIPV